MTRYDWAKLSTENLVPCSSPMLSPRGSCPRCITPPETGFHTRDFGRLPVLLNGRVQPLDSVARNTLLQIRERQSVGELSATRLADGNHDETRRGGQAGYLSH